MDVKSLSQQPLHGALPTPPRAGEESPGGDVYLGDKIYGERKEERPKGEGKPNGRERFKTFIPLYWLLW